MDRLGHDVRSEREKIGTILDEVQDELQQAAALQRKSKASRSKGARIEREIVHRHQDAGIPCEKVSRIGHTGEDLLVAETFQAEVKARADGAGFVTLERWLGTNALLFLRRDRQAPLVVLSWETYIALMKQY